MAKIKNVEVNGKSCYEIDNFLSPYFLAGQNKTIYTLEKDTGLVVASTIDDTITVIDYEFNNVDDTIFESPNVSEYTLQENS